MPGEPLGDPFPWVPLLSPLNMVVKAGAGSGWTWQAAACVLAGGSAGLWRGGAAGNREGRQFLGGPSLQVRPGSCACTHTRPHSHPLLHNQFGRKGQSQRAGRPSLPCSQGRSGLVTPTGSEGASSGHTQLRKQLGAGGTRVQTDGQRHACPCGLGDGRPASGLETGFTHPSSQCSGGTLRRPPPPSQPPVLLSPCGGRAPAPHSPPGRPGLCSVLSSDVMGKPGAFTPDDWHQVHLKGETTQLAPPSSTQRCCRSTFPAGSAPTCS